MFGVSQFSDSSKRTYFRPEERSIVDVLPLEIFENVLSCLNAQDLQQASMVSKKWNESTVYHVKQAKFLEFRQFVVFLCENLDRTSCASQIQSFEALLNGNKILHSINLIQIKQSKEKMSEPFLNILGELDEKTLEDLASKSKEADIFSFYQNLINSALIIQKTKKINEIKNVVERERSLKKLIKECVDIEQFEEALFVAHSLSDEKDATMDTIFKKWLDSRFIHQAIKKALKMPISVGSQNLRLSIASKLVKKDHFEEAFELALNLPSILGIAIFVSITSSLAKQKNIDKAEHFLSKIVSLDQREHVYMNLLNKLIESGYLEEALVVAKKNIQMGHSDAEIIDERNSRFNFHVIALCNLKELDIALRFAQLITDFEKRNVSLHHVSEAFHKAGKVEKADEIKKMIHSKSKGTLKSFFSKLKKK